MGKGITLRIFVSLLLGLLLWSACEEDQKDPVVDTDTDTGAALTVPKFNRDSAYTFVKKQVDFGPRVPNSAGHQATKVWLAEQLRQYGATVIEQNFSATAYTGTVLNGTNIIASFFPERSKRIFLSAHWDTRHIADRDPDAAQQEQPILGADDGASGVGVLIELARQLQQQPTTEIGVDIILFDAEDHGEAGGSASSYCLGSQHWSRNPHVNGYKAKYGILLDMVGAKNARFPKEGYSRQFAPQVVKKVWGLAKKLGYSNYFPDENVDPITDDHYFVNTIARIPTVDIINLPKGSTTGFVPHWHTQDDTMDAIDKRTLRTVGQLLLQVLYREDAGKL
ncbi:MAG: M28 family peptidase [Bacteroidota bacterium]